MREVRVRFRKTGKAKYISHLDLTRCFGRAITRARIPLWYTEGFNPRPYMNFSMPLTLGVEGMAEAMDLRIEGDMADEEIFSRLSAAMPPDITVYQVSAPVHKMTDIQSSRYEFLVEQHTLTPEALRDSFLKSAENTELYIEKLGKKGREKVMKQIPIYPHTKDFTASETEEGLVRVEVLLPSSNSFGINPKLFIDRYLLEAGVEPDYLSMRRLALYVESGEEFC